jgi:hypothetical protein
MKTTENSCASDASVVLGEPSNMSTAIFPFSAVDTLHPILVNMRFINVRVNGSSSTTSTRTPGVTRGSPGGRAGTGCLTTVDATSSVCKCPSSGGVVTDGRGVVPVSCECLASGECSRSTGNDLGKYPGSSEELGEGSAPIHESPNVRECMLA